MNYGGCEKGSGRLPLGGEMTTMLRSYIPTMLDECIHKSGPPKAFLVHLVLSASSLVGNRHRECSEPKMLQINK